MLRPHEFYKKQQKRKFNYIKIDRVTVISFVRTRKPVHEEKTNKKLKVINWNEKFFVDFVTADVIIIKKQNNNNMIFILSSL